MIRPRLIAKAALFNEKNELLLLTRSETDKVRPGEYDFPGGGVDEGETIIDAMLRETQEEIGVSLLPTDVSLVYSATDFYEEKSRVRFLFLGYIQSSQQIKLSYEHSDYKWVAFDEVLKIYNHPVWVGGLQYLISNKQLELSR